MQKSMNPVRFRKAGCQSEEVALKYPVRNRAVLRELRRLRAGKWKKVVKKGNFGEVHYFEHESGSVAGVNFFL